MKTLLPALLASFITTASFAQDAKLNDSVIFVNNKPVALYSKELSKSTARYNMEVYSFNNDVLIKAEVIKFNSPVRELKPFYYYELTFPPTGDIFSIYTEEKDFPLALAKIISDYDLISKNELNKKNVTKFISRYSGGAALLAKMKSVEDYLGETRYFNEQVKRDRTKPVTIINDRLIMQDGKQIGLIAEYQNAEVTNLPVSYYYTYDSTGKVIHTEVIPNHEITSKKETQVLLYNGRRIDNLVRQDDTEWKTWRETLKSEKGLYRVSKASPENKGIGGHTDDLLIMVSYLIENYAL